MSKNPDLYEGFEYLSHHDTTFILPIVICFCTFFFLKVSNHPWLINYTTQKQFKLFLLSFTFSLVTVFWPKCYFISWISYILTHSIIVIIRNLLKKYKERNLSYDRHVEKVYKPKIIDFLKIKDDLKYKDDKINKM
jgi:hypothetical protein